MGKNANRANYLGAGRKKKRHNRAEKRRRRKNAPSEKKREAKRQKRLRKQERRRTTAKDKSEEKERWQNTGPTVEVTGVLFDIAPHFSMDRTYVDLNTGLLKVSPFLLLGFYIDYSFEVKPWEPALPNWGLLPTIPTLCG